MSVETEKVGLANGRAPARRLRWRALAVLAVINLVAVGLVAAPSRAQITSCNGTMTDQTIEGTVVVSVGGFCNLQDVVVEGSVTLRADGALFMDGSRIRGGLTVEGGGIFTFVDMTDSRVDGMTTLGDGAILDSYSGRFNRVVDATAGGDINSNESTHWGGIRAENGSTTIVRGGFVVGGVRADGAFRADLYDTAVFGPVSVENGTEGTVLCHLGAALSVRANGNSDTVQVGTGPHADCGFNLFGSLTVNNNINAHITINGSVIAGNLECIGNDPAPFGGSNLVGGSRIGQCESLSPAPEVKATIQALQPAPRDNELIAEIQRRRDHHL